MRAVVQRVSRAQVTVSEEIVGKIGRGLLVLLGVAQADTEADADYLAEKNCRIAYFRGRERKDEPGHGFGTRSNSSNLAVHPLRRHSPRQTTVIRRGSPAPACPSALRVFCGTHPNGRHSMRNRPLPANDAGGIGE